MNYQAFENALESMEKAKAEIIRIEANDANRSTLDSAYRGLAIAIQHIEKLLEPDERFAKND